MGSTSHENKCRVQGRSLVAMTAWKGSHKPTAKAVHTPSCVHESRTFSEFLSCVAAVGARIDPTTEVL